MKHKVIKKDSVISHLHDGMSIMYGGFMGQGTPSSLVSLILQSGIKDLRY